MKRRGRSVIDHTAAVIIEGNFGARPKPPAELNARQQVFWREIVASEPTEYFATAALRFVLADLCRHRDTAEILSVAIDACDPGADDPGRYRNLLQMRALEVKAATSLATKLRLTNQSRYNALTASSNARNTLKGVRPWERSENLDPARPGAVHLK